jgi:hypothetical protein
MIGVDTFKPCCGWSDVERYDHFSDVQLCCALDYEEWNDWHLALCGEQSIVCIESTSTGLANLKSLLQGFPTVWVSLEAFPGSRWRPNFHTPSWINNGVNDDCDVTFENERPKAFPNRILASFKGN